MENIKTIPLMDRPREKLRYQGAQTLSDPELLATLLGTGTSSVPVLELCRQMLDHSGQELKKLSQMNVTELCQFRGIGEAKAVTLLAAFELAKRMEVKPTVQIRATEQIPEILYTYGVTVEDHSCRLLLLTASKHLLAVATLTALDTYRMPDIRTLLQIASDAGAAQMILCHCIPSADALDDTALSGFHSLLSGATALMGICLNDHLVITEGSTISLLS